MKKFCFLLILISLPCFLRSQNAVQQPEPRFIEGRIYEESTHEPVPHAKVVNQTRKKAVLADENGYFRIEISGEQDSVRISVIGFVAYWIELKEKTAVYEILLKENLNLLNEVTVVPEDRSQLYALLQDCRKNQPRARQNAKMYYELKSFVDNRQVELVENFYNGSIAGYDLEALDLKIGRFALQEFDHTFFGSMESSKAITMMKLLKVNDYFPKGPLELNAKKLKESYHLRLQGKYLDANRDSMYVIEFVPRDKTGRFFSGKLFVDPQEKQVVQVELHCANAQIHPFLPIFQTDTIQSLNLHITKSFEEIHGKMCFRDIDFVYETTYKNRSNTMYTVSTKAILYAYDFGAVFELPKFRFPQISDYRKINAIPYNAFFWENHEELKLSDQKNENALFYADPRSTTNQTIFSSNEKFDKGLLESPYLTWSGRRIRFREFSMDTIESPGKSASIISELYNLNVKIFLDVNRFSDMVHITTSTVFDPYESYYRLPLDHAALCFINIWFDLAEMERQNLENAIARSDKKTETIEKLYTESQDRLDALQQKYFKEVDHGQNRKAMEKWNQIVAENLKIDNLILFQPYESAGSH